MASRPKRPFLSKFYVASGDHQLTLLADSPKDAALKFVKHVTADDKDFSLGLIMQISQIGFEMEGPGHFDNDMFMSTEVALQQLEDMG